MKKVSVIIPIYNVSAYLRECLNSVIGQSLQELEIICANDGSTDNSLEIIREYAARDPRIVVITGPNGGYGKAMNKGLDRATGQYIGIVEPDDYIAQDMFAQLYQTAAEHDLDLVKADFYRFTRDSEGKEQRQYILLDATKQRYGQLLCPAEDPSCIRFTMNTWTGIYRRAFLEEFHIRHNETPGASFQDNGFFFQTFVYARRAMILNTPYYCNRRDNPNSSVKSKEKVYCMNVEYDYIRDLLMRDRNLWEKFQYMYWWIKYHSYWVAYNRMGDTYKEEYLYRMRQEFKRAMQLEQLREEEFTPDEWSAIQSLINSSGSAVDFLRKNPFVQTVKSYIPDSFKRYAVDVINRIILRKNKTLDCIISHNSNKH